jgi:hypothetical protein
MPRDKISAEVKRLEKRGLAFDQIRDHLVYSYGVSRATANRYLERVLKNPGVPKNKWVKAKAVKVTNGKVYIKR